MNPIATLFKREFFGYFRSPVAYVFMIVFVIASIGLTWFLGGFFYNESADLKTFFAFMPWIFMVFIPAVGMRLWAEERRSGTWELLFTLPVSVPEAVIAKFLAAWAFVGVSILSTISIVATISYLGDPDWGLIIAGYFSTILMAGTFLSICSLTSAVTKNQVISFVLGMIACLILVLLGWNPFNVLLDFLPTPMLDFVSNMGFVPHHNAATQGIITFKSFIYFISVSLFCLFTNVLVLER